LHKDFPKLCMPIGIRGIQGGTAVLDDGKDRFSQGARRRQFVMAGLVGLVALIAGLAAGWGQRSHMPEVAFIGLKGEQFSMSTLRGNVVLVNFWATSCAVCVKEMPRIVRTYEEFHTRGFETVAVAMSYDPPDRVFAYAQQNKLPFRVALDIHAEAMEAFGGIRGTPTSFLVDKRGRVVWRHEGEPDFPRLEALIDEKLAERS
jgi:peroxiredoxin